MVRLVFRPYTQIRRTICTSVSLRASTRVSPGFTLPRHRSPSFGSQQICSYSNLSQANDRSIVPPCGFLPQPASRPLLSLRIRVWHPNTRIYVRLLGPCFKTGVRKPFRQHRKPSRSQSTPVHALHHRRSLISKQLEHAGSTRHIAGYRILGQVQHMKLVCKATEEATFLALSLTNLTDADPLNSTGHLHTSPAKQHDQRNVTTLLFPSGN